jgi:hypothetical protein
MALDSPKYNAMIGIAFSRKANPDKELR